MKVKTIFFFITLILARADSSDQMVAKVWLLNNGGQILSNYQDWITMEISTHSMKDIVVCGEFIFEPGDQLKFHDFRIPIYDGEYLVITLKQRNLAGKDDSISIMSPMSKDVPGYYVAKLTLDQFRAGITLSFGYEGFQLEIEPYKYIIEADYYLLMELREETDCDPAEIKIPESQCKLYSSKLFYCLSYAFGIILMIYNF